MELEEKKSAAPEASLPMPELPADIPAEVRRKLAEDLGAIFRVRPFAG